MSNENKNEVKERRHIVTVFFPLKVDGALRRLSANQDRPVRDLLRDMVTEACAAGAKVNAREVSGNEEARLRIMELPESIYRQSTSLSREQGCTKGGFIVGIVANAEPVRKFLDPYDFPIQKLSF